MENFMVTSMFMSAFSKLSTGDARLDAALQIAASALAMLICNANMRHSVLEWLTATFAMFAPRKESGSVTLEYNHSMAYPNAYIAVMRFIETRGCGVSVLKSLPPSSDSPNKLCERYSIAQTSRVTLTPELYGLYSSTIIFDGQKHVCVDSFVLTSSTMSPQKILKFIGKCEVEYDRYRKGMQRSRSIVDISWNKASAESKGLLRPDIAHTISPWSSCASFDNRFFDDKKKLLDKIEFFVKNREWYASKGIPHTLGVLLWGEPGCGKTSFIKALANHALFRDKHIINIRLSKDFNLDTLGRILCNEYVAHNVYLPLDKRIIVLEDIDCMCDVVTDRKIPVLPNTRLELTEPENNNSLNTLLNILDGLNETSDRIIIITSNHPEKLDGALVRPGRIDINLHFQKASCAEIHDIVRHYWDLKADAALSVRIPERCARALSAAEVVNICRSSESAEVSYENILMQAEARVGSAKQEK